MYLNIYLNNEVHNLSFYVANLFIKLYIFTALSTGIPLLQPYLNKNVSLTHDYGVNFAVAGSPALPVETLAAQRILSP